MDRYVLELVVTFMTSLRYAHRDAAAASLAEHTELAARNLTRIVVAKVGLGGVGA